MFKPFTVFIGLRYAVTKQRNQLVSFISLVSMLGMTVGVALLIVVLSVMNGFDKEMRERILGLVPHITIKNHGEPQQWQAIELIIKQHADVEAVAPFIQMGGMLIRGADVESVMIYGIDAERESSVSIINQFLLNNSLTQLAGASDNAIIGKALAQRLQLVVGDSINIMLAEQNISGKITPRFKRLKVSALFETGTEVDQSVALISFDTAQVMATGDSTVRGLRVLLSDTLSAPRVAWELEQNLPYGFSASDWTHSHGNLYSAIQLSKQLVGLMLLTIIAVAAFNVVSALVMIVTDKQSDIAILRTIGLSPKAIMAIFVVQGAFIGLIGTILGVLFGLLLSVTVSEVVAGLEALFNYQFLSSDVYPIDYMPVDIRLNDIVLVATAGFTMSVLATLYPAWRAAKVQPAEALRYE
ncbi:MAG: lipoprotein-releasing system permease protein [Pseudohongiellaceae bacterium]|jgi:lipoprotein-releasing system permease protein